MAKTNSLGFFDRFLNGMDSGINAAFSGLDKAFASSDAKKRFRELFPQLPVQERLHAEFNGQVLDGAAGSVSCAVYLSDNYFSFAIIHPYGGKTKISFLYSDVANAQRGLYARAPMPHIIPQQSPSERADSLLIFTNTGAVHMFTTFLHYHKLCAAFFNIWQQKVPTPVAVQPSQPIAAQPPINPECQQAPPTQQATPQQVPQQFTPYPYPPGQLDYYPGIDPSAYSVPQALYPQLPGQQQSQPVYQQIPQQQPGFINPAAGHYPN